MGILSNLRSYNANKWNVKSKSSLKDEADYDQIKEVVVVESDFGASLCLKMSDGNNKYIPVRSGIECQIGQSVNPENVTIMTLGRVGNDDIYKAEF